MRRYVVGFMPELAGGLRTLAGVGQHLRLLHYYCRPYLEAFARIYYFSYHQESLADYVTEPDLLQGVTLLPRMRVAWPKPYALTMAIQQRAAFRECHVLRVFQATGILPAVMARQWYGLPVVVTYGLPYAEVARQSQRPAWKVALYALLEALTFRFADGIIVTTEYLKERVCRHVTADRVHLVPNGVDTDTFSPRSRHLHRGGGREVVFVGRLEPQKDLPTLLKAASLLAQWGQPVHLRLIGAGSLRTALAQQASSLGVQASFMGTVKHGQLPALLRNADAFVFPSQWGEGHPKALIEAMSCGVPCVVSDCQGNRALIRHEDTGLLFSVGDAQALAKQVARLLGDADLAAALGKRARAYAFQHLDVRALVRREVAILQTLAEERCHRVGVSDGHR